MPRAIEQILRDVRIEEVELDPAVEVGPDTPLGEVLRLLDEKRVGAVLVTDEKLIGIFTDRDVLYRTALEKIDPETPIETLMSRDLKTLSKKQSLGEAIALMNSGGYRHVPLVDSDGRAVGELSSRALLRHVVSYFPEAVLNLPPALHQTLIRPEGG